MPRVHVTATIAAGQSISSAIDCRSAAPVIIYMPTAWTSARLCFLASHDGTTYRDLFDRLAKEIAVNVQPGTAIKLNAEWTDHVLGAYFKIRSGSRDNPISQAADRVFTVTIDTSAVVVQTLPAP